MSTTTFPPNVVSINGQPLSDLELEKAPVVTLKANTKHDIDPMKVLHTILANWDEYKYEHVVIVGLKNTNELTVHSTTSDSFIIAGMLGAAYHDILRDFEVS